MFMYRSYAKTARIPAAAAAALLIFFFSLPARAFSGSGGDYTVESSVIDSGGGCSSPAANTRRAPR